MLPAPVSFTSRDNTSRHRRPLLHVLLARSRLTNLGVLLLAAFAALSLLSNALFYFHSPNNEETRISQQHAAPSSISSTISRTPAVQALDHLVVVPGHAIWRGPTSNSRLDENEWILEPFQRDSGRTAAFISHIERGLEIASNDQRALLIFSGGQTRPTSTTSEAESYLRLAHHIAERLSPDDSNRPPLRATSEDHALDSFQNLLFSIARFHEFTGHYPQHITVVGYEMKRRRFTELHRAAIRWPHDRFTYIGGGVDIQSEHERLQAHQGERENGYIPYSSDVYGCHSSLLAKRFARNPFARYHPYYTSSPELRHLFDWCPGSSDGGTTALFPGKLPWSYS